MDEGFRVGDLVRMRCQAHLMFGHTGRVTKTEPLGGVYVKFEGDNRKLRWCWAVHLEHASVLDRLARI